MIFSPTHRCKKVFLFIGLLMSVNAAKAQNDILITPGFAHSLAQKYIIVDGHVDLPYRLKVKNFRLEKEFSGIPIQSDEGDFDYVRAKKGGLDAPIMSIYIPASYQQTGGARELADSLIAMVKFIADENQDYFEIATTPAEIRAIKQKGKIALPMGMENGAPVEDDPSLVGYFRKQGISYITLTHSKDNKICDSSYDTTRTWKGHSPYGYEIIREMQKVGMMIDISHVSDSTFYQVIRSVEVPVIASHSSCRKFTPGFERNMDDDMILKMKENGGVIMVNFGSDFLDGNISKHNRERRSELRNLLSDNGIEATSEEGRKMIEEFQNQHPALFSDIKMVADHIDHIVRIAGVEHVGFGSDYDGVGDSLPTGLKDVSDYPNLLHELLIRGYSEMDIEKMCSGNIFRVWDAVLNYSTQ